MTGWRLHWTLISQICVAISENNASGPCLPPQKPELQFFVSSFNVAFGLRITLILFIMEGKYKREGYIYLYKTNYGGGGGVINAYK